MPTDPVLIVGAGLGGLALAQSLHRQQIPFRIFERDPQTDARAQGWAISLHAWLMDEMRSSMRDDESGLRALAPSAPLGLPSQGAIFALKDGGRKELFRFGEGTPLPFVRVDRGKLRNWLLQGIDVEWEKKFVKYEEDGSGVTVHFEDGSSARGTALIGADGINSRVRSQLLNGGGQPTRLPIGIVVGEVNADPEQYHRWLQPASSFSVALADNIRLFIGLKSLSDDLKSAHFYWMFGWADQDAAKEGFWTKNASSHELRDFVLQRIEGLDPDYIEPFLATSEEGILLPPLQMRDMTPPALPLGRVTLLGDAVHPMVPFRGEGGNMAMKDAMEITKCLAKLGNGDVAKALKTYEEEMTKRAGESVIRSRESTFPSQEMFRS